MVYFSDDASLEVTRRYARLSDKTREEKYFRALAIIEKGAAGDHAVQSLKG